MPGSKSKTASWYAWTEQVDKALLDETPIERPEVCISEDDVIFPAQWYSWDKSQWKFRCLLCAAWCDNDGHLEGANHRSNRQWEAQKWVNFKLKRVAVNAEYDWYDPWGLQKRLGVGKFAGSVPALPQQAAASNYFAVTPWVPPQGPPGIVVDPSEPRSDMSDVVEDVRKLAEEVRLLNVEVRTLRDEMRASVLGGRAAAPDA